MLRRKFIRNVGLGVVATGFIPNYGLTNWLPATVTPVLVPLTEPIPQIRHGALNLPVLSQEGSGMPFDWLLQVHRNIFFKNGFQRSEDSDLEIISILLKEGDTMEALQVQLSPATTTVMLGDRLYELLPVDGLQQIGGKELEGELYLGTFASGKNYGCTFPNDSEIFLQVLEGLITCNEQLLDTSTGFALANTGEEVKIKVEVDSRVLFLCQTFF